ncbi:MAG: maleylacetoacetate isomerase [Bdellovibrionota bacterium]
MDQIVLYNYFRSSTSYRVRIGLHHKKIDFLYYPIHLLKNGGEQHSPEYRKISPLGEVPTLVHTVTPTDRRVIGQSLPILEYLEEVFPQNPLLPKDLYLKAKVRQFCENVNAFMHPLGNLKVLQHLEADHGFDQAKKETWVQHWLTQGFTALEHMIKAESKIFALSDEITMADLFLAPQIFTARRFKVDMKKFARVLELEDKYTSIKAFQDAHPSRQMDTPEEERSKG